LVNAVHEELANQLIRVRHQLRRAALAGCESGDVEATLDSFHALSQRLDDPTLSVEHGRWCTLFGCSPRSIAV
jgi:hypothetical protein